MNRHRQGSDMTIGQAFAARWLVRKYAEYKNDRRRQQRQPGLPQPDELAERIAEAVDSHVDKKVLELRRKLHAIALGVADGTGGSKDQVVVSSDELLEDTALVHVAQECLTSNLDRMQKFPV